VEWVCEKGGTSLFVGLLPRSGATALDLEFNRAQTGLAIDNDVTSESIALDLELLTTQTKNDGESFLSISPFEMEFCL